MLRMSSSAGLLRASLPDQAALHRPVPSGAEAKVSTAAVSTCSYSQVKFPRLSGIGLCSAMSVYGLLALAT